MGAAPPYLRTYRHAVSSRPYDVLLLDFGGVCLLNPVEMHARAEAELGLPPGTIDWKGPIDPDTDPLWRRMIAGNGFSERDYWAHRANELGQTVGRAFTVADYMQLIFDPPTPEMIRPGADAVARAAIDAGIGVSVLTNDMRVFHGREWEHDVDFLQLVNHIVDCSDTGILKPDPRAFQRAVDIVDAPPERVLFVDDQPINVEGGDHFGLGTMWFDIANAEAAWRSVRERLGLGGR